MSELGEPFLKNSGTKQKIEVKIAACEQKNH